MAYPPYPTGNIPSPPHVARGEQSADSDGGDRAERIVASRRLRSAATGNPTLMYQGRRIVVVRHAGTETYGFTLDRGWARGRWASEGEAKMAAAVALLALPRKPRRRPARTDRLGLTRWIAARADAEGRDDEDDDDGEADEQSERNFA